MKSWKRSGRFNRHHLKNKCKGGQSIRSNLILLDTERHNAWHFLFGNMSLDEVIGLLIKLRGIKNSQKKKWFK